MKKLLILLLLTGLGSPLLLGQRFLNSGIEVKVVPDPIMTIHFDHLVRDWQGFGVNYVEACQTRDYSLFPQDYSGFSFASEEAKQTVMEMIWGEDGLRPGLTKLFLDPFHEGRTEQDNDDDDPMKINMAGFDHSTTTRHMRFFNREGYKMLKSWGGSLEAMVTLYAPAPWMTRQKFVLGRDLDSAKKLEVAEYMVSWAKFLMEEEGLPIKYISLHNEGDAYYRWPRDGSNPGEDHRDYNSYWSPSQVVEFLKITQSVLDANNMGHIGLSPGETQTWFRFDQWGYASAIAYDQEALANLALISSHSFAYLDDPTSVYHGDYRSIGQDLLHEKKPGIPVWVTSRPWTNGIDFIENIRRDIYDSKANGVIPWAIIAGDKQWLGSNMEYMDASRDKPFVIDENGELTITKNYFFYKQITRAGQPGSRIAEVTNMDPSLGAIAFQDEKSHFIVINKSSEVKEIKLNVRGSSSKTFRVVRTSDEEDFEYLRDESLANEMLLYSAPPRSVTTFFGY